MAVKQEECEVPISPDHPSFSFFFSFCSSFLFFLGAWEGVLQKSGICDYLP